MSNTEEIVYIDSDLLEIVPGYLSNIRQYCKDIQTALESKDYESIQRIGHGLKGTGSGYGFDKITEWGAQIETAAKENKPEVLVKTNTILSDYVNTVKYEGE